MSSKGRLRRKEKDDCEGSGDVAKVSVILAIRIDRWNHIR
jgi:hypothetical protein